MDSELARPCLIRWGVTRKKKARRKPSPRSPPDRKASLPASAGDEAGIRRGDIIVEVDRKAVRSIDDYKKAVAGVRKGRGVLFLVRRGDSTLFLALKPQR